MSDLHMDPAKLQWVNNLLPASIASYVIAMLSVAGCAMFTFFFAQMLQQICFGYVSGFVSGFAKSAPATEDANG
jgi:hypothetical protein